MDVNFFLLILVGFLAQLIDGALGMAYGVSANSFLLGVGIPPAAASASVHTAEIFTTAVSGLSHWKLGNIDRNLVKRLIIPGILGGALGAYVLSNIDGNRIKPYIAVYLILMAVRIIHKAFHPSPVEKSVRNHLLIPLGLVGGTMDAIGGGGWGPIVTTTLISAGQSPQKSIGSVNLTEFFVTFAEVVVFITSIGFTNGRVILGLLIGGLIAAPLGAILTKKIPAKTLMVIVGLVIIFLQARTLYLMYF